MGQIKIRKELISEEEVFALALEAGVEDCISGDKYHEIFLKENFNDVRTVVEKN